MAEDSTRAWSDKAFAESKRADRAEFLAAQLYTELKVVVGDREPAPEVARAMEMYEEWERENG